MKTTDILNTISGDRSEHRYSFEVFVQNLLTHYYQLENVNYQVIEGREFGTLIVNGEFDNLKGEILIEVKSRLNRFPRSIFDSLVRRPLRDDKSTTIDHLVFISDITYSSQFLDRIRFSEITQDLPYKVHLWGSDKINEIINKYPDKSIEIAENIFSLRIESKLKSTRRSWKEERGEKLLRIKGLFEKGQFSLFLGAGVSSSAGMPNWNTLLNSLFVEYLTNEFDNEKSISDSDIKQIVSRLNEIDEPSALMAARYLRKGLSKDKSEDEEFLKVITENLYKLKDKDKPLDSKLIKTICNLCMPKRTGAKVRSVITYNFDDLIERQLSKIEVDYHSIYTDNESYELDELPIYHVHGFLPEDRQLYQDLDNSTLVFSEEGYHKIYSDSFHWSNLVQLNSLRENSCLMIGLSLTDPNLRRLLEIASRNNDRVKHFAFLKRIKTEEFINKQSSSKSKPKKVIKNDAGAIEFLSRHHILNEELMKELGVTIIWFEEYADIPRLLETLRSK